MYDKSIAYDRETRDYAMRLDGELVGFARNYHEAEITLDQLVYELLSDGHFATAVELDGGAVECNEPDNLCDVHNPCPAHAADAARYLAEHLDTVRDDLARIEDEQYDMDFAQSQRVIIGHPCPTCNDEGDCPDCGTYTTPILIDCLNVIDMALGHTYGAASVVSELRRLKARIEAAAECDAARV
jgi:hypothetical protein